MHARFLDLKFWIWPSKQGQGPGPARCLGPTAAGVARKRRLWEMQPFPLTFSVSFSNFQAKGNVEWPFCPWVKIGMNPLRGTKKENINKFEFCYDKKQHQRHKLLNHTAHAPGCWCVAMQLCALGLSQGQNHCWIHGIR